LSARRQTATLTASNALNELARFWASKAELSSSARTFIASTFNGDLDIDDADLIVTHNRDGEYGHKHHKEVHNHLTQKYGEKVHLLRLPTQEWIGQGF
jgi:hypothetical protein